MGTSNNSIFRALATRLPLIFKGKLMAECDFQRRPYNGEKVLCEIIRGTGLSFLSKVLPRSYHCGTKRRGICQERRRLNALLTQAERRMIHPGALNDGKTIIAKDGGKTMPRKYHPCLSCGSAVTSFYRDRPRGKSFD